MNGIMMVVSVVAGSGDGEQQRRRGNGAVAVDPGRSVVRNRVCNRRGCVNGVGPLGRQPADADHRGVCRVFVNVCEVREWSGPGVAA